MAALPGATRGPRKVLDEDGSCPDCGQPSGHGSEPPAGLPRCPDNWTGKHLDRVNARAERAYQRYEDGADDTDPEGTDDLYRTFRRRADEAEWVHQIVESGHGHSWWNSL